jgi:salicylate hydroxylase
MSNYKVEDEAKKLTIEEMNGYDMHKDIDQAFAERDRRPYTGRYVKGLPFGLKLSNGITVDCNTNLPVY